MPQPEERRQVIDAAKAIAFYTQGLLVTLIVFFVAGVIALTLRDARSTLRKSSPPLPLATERVLENRVVALSAEGIDSQGRQVQFEFLIWPRDVRWMGDESPALETSSRILQPGSDITSLFGPNVMQEIAEAQTLLALTSVSDWTGKSSGEKVAARRAEVATQWLAQISPKSAVPIYELNLGRYHSPCGRCDGRQNTWRNAFVLVVERRKEFSAILSEALKYALSNHRNLPSPTRFSTFSAVRFKGAATSKH